MLENAVSQHVLRRIVTMRPDQRHSIAILVLEGTVQNRPSVRAPQSILRGPTTEVGLLGRMHQTILRRRVTEVQSVGLCSHFDCSFRLLDLRRSQSAASFCLATASCPFTLVASVLSSESFFDPVEPAFFLSEELPPPDLSLPCFALVFNSCLCSLRYFSLSRDFFAFSAAVSGLSRSLEARSFLALPLRSSLADLCSISRI